MRFTQEHIQTRFFFAETFRSFLCWDILVTETFRSFVSQLYRNWL